MAPPVGLGAAWHRALTSTSVVFRLVFQLLYSSLLGHVNTVQELSDILIFDRCGLLDQSSWNREARVVSTIHRTQVIGQRVKGHRRYRKQVQMKSKGRRGGRMDG